MTRLTYRNRRSAPIHEMQNGVIAALARFGAEFLESDSFQHGLSKGEEREVPIQQFFRRWLPDTFRVDKGEVVDIFGRTSPQLDLLITDGMRNAPLRRGSIVIMPAEALLVSVEVKSCLTLAEIKTSLNSARELRRLRPFKSKLAERRRKGKPADDRSRYFHSIFAYGTDLSVADWLKREFSRMQRASRELRIPLNVIDRMYVASRGLINIPASTGTEEEPKGTAFLQYYMHTLNFLLRENRRRKETPYLEYAGKMSGKWTSLATPGVDEVTEKNAAESGS